MMSHGSVGSLGAQDRVVVGVGVGVGVGVALSVCPMHRNARTQAGRYGCWSGDPVVQNMLHPLSKCAATHGQCAETARDKAVPFPAGRRQNRQRRSSALPQRRRR